jgi:hypothetical protein
MTTEGAGGTTLIPRLLPQAGEGTRPSILSGTLSRLRERVG